MPTINKIHNDKILSELSVQYKNAEYIADEVFPKLPVKKLSDKYYIFVKDFKIPETIRSIKGIAREASFDLSTASYNLEKHSLKDYVSDDEKDNYDLKDLLADTTEFLTDKIKLRKEKITADLIDNTGTWSLGVSLAATGLWTSNSVGSNPIPVIDTGASTIITYSGVKPNRMILPRDGFVACKHHVSILDRVKYTSKEMTVATLEGLFDMEKILVPTVQYDTAAPGVAASVSALWADFALLYYHRPNAGAKSMVTGRMIQKVRPSVRRWRDDEREAEAVEVTEHFQPRIVASLTGYHIKNTV